MKNNWTITSPEELNGLAQALIGKLEKDQSDNSASVLTLHGDLGAGKTTLTQTIARKLGVTQAVRSPTFVISKEYQLNKQKWDALVHIDAYRLDGENLEPLGFEELFTDPRKLIIIEWAEYLNPILPKQHTDLTITLNKQDDSRNIDVNQTAKP